MIRIATKYDFLTNTVLYCKVQCPFHTLIKIPKLSRKHPGTDANTPRIPQHSRDGHMPPPPPPPPRNHHTSAISSHSKVLSTV